MTETSADELISEFEKLKDKYIKDLLKLKLKIDNYCKSTHRKILSKSKVEETIRAIYGQINITCLDSEELENRENEENIGLKQYLGKFFTDLELETIKYIAQDFTTSEIVKIYKSKGVKVKNTTIERRKEYILEKIYKYFPNIAMQGKTISTIKELAYGFHILDTKEKDMSIVLKHYLDTKLF